jgi:outer membrane protein assembly factor BamE
MLSVNSMSVSGAIIPDISLPDRQVLELLESGPDWLPKPYKTPIEQGALLEAENLNKVVPGLSKEQVKFLLGTPTIIDIFHNDRWDYIFYERDETGFTDPKRITVIFKNERLEKYIIRINSLKKWVLIL